MGNLGFTEILIILLVVLLLFGAKRLPEMGASLGKGIREFKRSLSTPRMRSWGRKSLARCRPASRKVPVQEMKPSGEPKRLSQQ